MRRPVAPPVVHFNQFSILQQNCPTACYGLSVYYKLLIVATTELFMICGLLVLSSFLCSTLLVKNSRPKKTFIFMLSSKNLIIEFLHKYLTQFVRMSFILDYIMLVSL